MVHAMLVIILSAVGAGFGPEWSVLTKLRRYLNAGATDVVLVPLDRSKPVDHEPLWRLAASL